MKQRCHLILYRIDTRKIGPFAQITTVAGKCKIRMIVRPAIDPIRMELEREKDGRILASLPDLPGVMAFGVDEGEARRKV